MDTYTHAAVAQLEERRHGKTEVTSSSLVSGSKRDTKTTGELAEAMVLARLLSHGWKVSIPFGEGHRYDLILDRDGELSRIQVKTARISNGAVTFKAHSTHAHRGGSLRNYAGDVEAFCVYCPANGKIYFVPIEDTATTTCYLRVEEPKNRQTAKIRWATDYEI